MMSTRTAILLALALVSPVAAGGRVFSHPDRVRYDGQCMTIDGKDLMVYGGVFHYFRCPKALWRDRFEKIKEAGFNAVESYVPWNRYEPQKPAGLDDFSKIDLSELDDWLKMAEDFGLYVIIRPGPYICAEWDRGGLPGWLMSEKPADPKQAPMWLRSDDPRYVASSKHWYDAVCPLLARHQITRRKPGQFGIILFQVENEYDYSGMPEAVKAAYVKALAQEAIAKGIDVPLFTCWTRSIRGQSDPVLSQLFDSCNFYPRWNVDSVQRDITALRRSQPDAPLMTTELQGGWFTGVDSLPAIRPDSDRYDDGVGPAQITNLTLFVWQNGETLTNYYMLFGGTNFGDTAARNIATSYDYSAPIRECGGVGEKYLRVKALGEMVREHGPRLARARAVDCDVTTGSRDVTVVERRAAEGSRYLFVRTSQHSEPRRGTAHVKERTGGTEISFEYELEPFGAKVLYLPAGVTDASRGQWLPKEPPAVRRPSDLPGTVQITAVRAKNDPGPSDWKPLATGKSLNDVGIEDSRFVFYRTNLNATDQDLKAPDGLSLRVGCPNGDHALALLNGQWASPTGPGDGPPDVRQLVHGGENQLELLYENTGCDNIGPGIEKLSGVTRVRLVRGMPKGASIGNWKMTAVRRLRRPEQAPGVMNDAGDQKWTSVSTDQAQQLRPRQSAVFRTEVELTPADLAAGHTALAVARMDDSGWVFVNGKKVGQGNDWAESYVFDATGALHVGRNAIAIVVQNRDGAGGLGSVSWTVPEKAVGGTALSYSDEPAGVAGKWWDPALDDSGWTHQLLPETSSKPEALLSWRRLEFQLPQSRQGEWVPWLLRLDASGNGFIYLNGHPLGRYWATGKQRDFYLPECWLNSEPGKKNVVALCLRPTDGGVAVRSAQVMPYAVYAEKR